MDGERRVLLIADAFAGYHRRVMAGVGQFAATVDGWAFRNYASTGEDAFCEAVIRRWRPTGVIAVTRLWTPPLVAAAAAGIPIVVGHELNRPDDPPGDGESRAVYAESADVPQVFTNAAEVAALVVDYFVGRGLRSVAWAGPDHAHVRRQAGVLRGAAAARGLAFATYRGELRHEMEDGGRFRHWLEPLPRPTGIFTASDWYAWHVVSECRAAGCSVPDDFAVLGTGDDSPWCGLAPVPLSSVSLAAEKIGHRAAATLDRLMRGDGPPGPARVAVPPAGIVTRRSTDLIAAEDPDVAAALRYAHANAARGCTVSDVLAAVPIDRRRLERWCRQKLGRSPGDELRRLRMAYVKRLLSETDDPAAEVARRAGFASLATLCRTFGREAGTTVAGYRRQFRGGGGG